MRFERFAALAVASLFAAGCGAGAGSSLPAPTGISSAAPAPRISGAPPTTVPTSLQVGFKVALPAATVNGQSRSPKFISAGTQSATVTVAPSGGSAGSPATVNCTTVCQGSVNAPVGTDTFTINLYSAQNGTGSILSTGSLTQAIVVANTNTVNVTFDGVPASLAVSGIPSGTLGTAFGSAQAFAVAVKDASGNTIVGTYATPLTLSNSDASGATSLVTSGSDAPPAGELLSSSDVVKLNFTGAALASTTIGATANGAGSASATFQPAPVLTSLAVTGGVAGGGVDETLNGHLVPGATAVSFGANLTVSNLNVTATAITAHVFIDPSATIGGRSVGVQSVGGLASGTQTFTVSNTGVNAVTLATDTAPGQCPAGSNGDLRFALCHASSGDTIIFDTTAMCGGTTPCTITLAGPLPPIEQNQTIDGGQFGRVQIDGASNFRAFFVDTGTVAIQNLQVQNAAAKGGAGGSGGGGGGLGAGGGLFVNQGGANVTVSSAFFSNSSSIGGVGGPGSTASAGGAGGGGLAFAGGAGTGTNAGAGGGGVLAIGAAAPSANVGGAGGAGGGAGGGAIVTAGAGGTAYGTNSTGNNGASGSGSAGGVGGFGGGGGGLRPPAVMVVRAVLAAAAAAPAEGIFLMPMVAREAPAGLGGGGGAGGNSGGGTGVAGVGGAGGLLATLSGGRGGNGADGGGGAAAGPAIFVNVGSLTIVNSGSTGSAATGGISGGAATAGTADATPVFNFGGMVNGSITSGPLGGFLPNVTP